MFRKMQQVSNGTGIIAVLVTTAALLLAGSVAFGQTNNWAAGITNDEWNVGTNWSTGFVPGVGTNAFIGPSVATTVNYTNPMVAADIAGLTVTNTTAAATFLEIMTNGFNVAGHIEMGRGTLEVQAGGVATCGTMNVRLGSLVNVNGGTFSNGTMQIGGNNAQAAGGRVNLGGNGTLIANTATLGGSVEGGSLTISSGYASIGSIRVFRHPNGIFSQGVRVTGGALSTSRITIGSGNSTASFAVGGGTVTNTGPFLMGDGTATRTCFFFQTNGVTCSLNSNIIVGSFGYWSNRFLIAGGTLTAPGIQLLNDVTNVPTMLAVLAVTNQAIVYLGATGISNATPLSASMTYTVLFGDTAKLGANSNWSSRANISLTTGTPTILCAGEDNVAHDISLSGNLTGSGGLIKDGAGILTLSGTNTYSGITTISNGIIVAGIAENAGVSGPFGNQAANAAGTILVTGGTLRYSANNNNDYSGRFSTGGSQPFRIDVAGRSVSFGTTLQGSGTSLTLTNSSGSPGSLTLAATGNNYDGSTTVNGGTLKVNGSITGTGAVTVNSGALLGGTGTISGAVTINSGGGLAPGNSVGALNVGSLTMSSGTTNTFEFNSAPANDQVVVANTDGLVINGGVFTLISAADSSPWTVPGTYNLIQYSGTIGGSGLDSSWTTSSATNPHVANPQAGFQYAFGTSGGWVTLTITGTVTFNYGTWSVNSDGNWSVPGNWTATTGTMPPRNATDIASFGTGTVLRTVTLNSNETVGALNFNNANSFVIANAGKTLTLDNSGPAATVNVADGTANSIQSAISLIATQTLITVSSGKSLSITAAVSSPTASNTLVVGGAGTVALSGTNTYGPAAGAVGTTLSGATLQLGSSGALGAGDLSLTASAGIKAGASVTVSNNVSLGTNTATATVDTSGNNLTLAGVVSGSGGGLTKVGNGVLTLGAANTYFNNTTIAGGILRLGVDGAIPSGGSTTGWLVLDGGDTVAGTLDLSGRNVTVNALSGTNNSVLGQIVNDSGTGTNSLTMNNGTGISTLFAGNIRDNTNSSVGAVAVTMTGAGTLNLSGNNSYSGGTTVSNGTLILSGNNSYSARTIVSNGTLRLGNNNALGSGTLTMSGGNLDSTVGNMSNNNPQNWNSNFTFIGTSALDMGNGAVTLGVTCQVTVSANTLQVGGVISGPFGLTKAGAGTLTVKGVNTYSGNTTAAGGNLLIDSGGVITGGQASVSAVGGALIEVRNGALFATSGTITPGSAGLLVSGGTATFSGSLSMPSSGSVNSLIRASSGTLTVGSLSLGRTQNASTAQPTAGETTRGMYINGGTVNVVGNLSLGDDSAANSVVNTRIDDGYLNVGGALIVGLNNTGRWSDLDVEGGTLNINDTTMGLSIGSSQAGNAIFLMSGGTATTPKISLGQGTNNGTSAINLAGGSLFIGSGGIVRVSTNIVTSIFLKDGALCATQDWSSSVSMTVSGALIYAADQDGNARNITLNGAINGTGLTKTGDGMLTLGGTNTYASGTTVNAGTLRVNGSVASDVNANGGTTLGGNGTINASASVSGGTLSPGASPGTLTVTNNLSLDSGAVLNFQLGASSSKVVVGNTLNFNLNHLNVVDSGNIGAGTYTLFTAATLNDNTGLGGSFSRSANPSYFGSVPNASWGYLVTVSPSAVVLTISNAPPMVNFSGTPTNGAAALNVSFTDLSDTSVYPILSRTWNFGDGATSTTASPSHNYTTNGVYTVSLIASNAFGVATNTKPAYITVADPPPVANFTGNPLSGTAPLQVVFTNASVGQAGLSHWIFGDNTTNDTAGILVTNTYAAAGSYTVSLTVTNDGGSSNLVKAAYISVCPAPVAAFTGSPLSGTAPLQVVFTNASVGQAGLSHWTFGDNTTNDTANTIVTNTYATAGSYTVSLAVSNNCGSNIVSTIVNYINVTSSVTPEQAFSNYYGVAANNADSDGDGISNTNEFLAGFNPTNSAAYLHVLSIAKSGNDMNVTYLGSNGDTNYAGGPVSRTNVLEYSTGQANGSYTNDFASTGQTNILSGGTGLGVITNMTDSGGSTNGPARYYRVRVLVP